VRTRTPLLGVGLALAVLLIAIGVTLGADPTAVPAEVLGSGDLRSEGEGPGLVGSPLLILGGVVVLGVVTALATALIVRLAQRH
jgi:hypothetical protein